MAPLRRMRAIPRVHSHSKPTNGLWYTWKEQEARYSHEFLPKGGKNRLERQTAEQRATRPCRGQFNELLQVETPIRVKKSNMLSIMNHSCQVDLRE